MPTTKVAPILWKLTRPCFQEDAAEVDLTIEEDDDDNAADADADAQSTNDATVDAVGNASAPPVTVVDESPFPVMSGKKLISYGNSRLATNSIHQSFQAWLDKQRLRGDAMKGTGAMSRPSKWHRCTVFLNPEVIPGLGATNFNACGCFTTRAMGSAGWDDLSIHYICSIDFPTDILSIAQEKGRAGRRLGADGSDDIYYCCASLEAYLYLLRRFSRETPSDDGADPEDERLFDRFITSSALRQHQLYRLSQVLDLFMLPNECQQCMLERGLANPFSNPAGVTLFPCGNLCQFCINGGIHPKFPRVHVAAVCAALLDLPDAQLLFFGVRSKSLPKPIDIKNLLLMLITAGILTHRVVQRDVTAHDGTISQPPIILARLQMKPDLTVALYDDAIWSRLPTIAV